VAWWALGSLEKIGMSDEHKRNLSELFQRFYLNRLTSQREGPKDPEETHAPKVEEDVSGESLETAESNGTLPFKEPTQIASATEIITENWERSRKEIMEERRLRLRREVMSTLDTFLLYFPSIPLFLWTLQRGKQGLRGYTFLWVFFGFIAHYAKKQTTRWPWFGLLVSPLYLFITEGIATSKWKRSSLFSLMWFLTSVMAVRVGGTLALQKPPK